jgi:hypothetical protein
MPAIHVAGEGKITFDIVSKLSVDFGIFHSIRAGTWRVVFIRCNLQEKEKYG